jgi:phosphoribosylglycinamide formyltransferase-1
MSQLRLGFLASHNGTNVRAIIEAVHSGLLPQIIPAVIISNNQDASILTYAQAQVVPQYCINTCTAGEGNVDAHIAQVLQEHQANLVILSGYMKPIGPVTLQAFPNKIMNVHPALLPKYGGKGMYGDKVHQTVLDNQDPFTGATLHWVNEQYDEGQIIKQSRVKVEVEDSVETLRKRVQAAETQLFLEVLDEMSK